jgi:hypothetical protein
MEETRLVDSKGVNAETFPSVSGPHELVLSLIRVNRFSLREIVLILNTQFSNFQTVDSRSLHLPKVQLPQCQDRSNCPQQTIRPQNSSELNRFRAGSWVLSARTVVTTHRMQLGSKYALTKNMRNNGNREMHRKTCSGD